MRKTVTCLALGWVAMALAPVSLTAQEVPNQADDGAAVRKAGNAYVETFNRRDAEGLAAFWSPDAVYINRISGEQVVGRASIAEQFRSLFESAAKLTLEVDVDSVEFVSPNVALEQGTARFISPESAPELVTYSAVYVRHDEKWLLDRVTDKSSQTANTHYEQLKQLEWFIGSWVDQDESVSIVTECKWTENKKFITRSFTVSADDILQLSGIQVIGWDSGSKQVRSWTFDSAGGFSEGVWSKSKDRWYIHKKGTTGEGESTTAVNHVTPVDDNTFAFQSTQRTLAGKLLPNIDEVLVVRR
jgi:uncharacterized protein (TIGR02246 family)